MSREQQILEERLAIAHEQGRREGWADCTAAIIEWMRRPGFWLNVTSYRQLRRGAVGYREKEGKVADD